MFGPSTGHVKTAIILASPVMSANLLVRAAEDGMNKEGEGLFVWLGEARLRALEPSHVGIFPHLSTLDRVSW